MKSEFFECICFSDEHTLRFLFDEKDNTLYTTIFLHQYRNIIKRIWIAIKYTFGYRCKYGHWDCWELKKEDISRLIKTLKQVKVNENI